MSKCMLYDCVLPLWHTWWEQLVWIVLIYLHYTEDSTSTANKLQFYYRHLVKHFRRWTLDCATFFYNTILKASTTAVMFEMYTVPSKIVKTIIIAN